ncbi:MAG: LysR family transcriptional regulator [Neisseria sp.]|nr:LysR family transcriptional regulator [Neisseria sp.]
MDFNQLKSFITVAHQRNLTQAAERLFLSQPAVSAQIKSLETELQTALFVRTNNGMQLTRAGEALLPEVESLLQHRHRLEQFAQTLASNYSSEAELGLIHPVDAQKVCQLVQTIQNDAPQTQLHIQYGMSGEILARILNKTLHGGFFLGEIKQKTVRSIFLENIHYSLICPQEIQARHENANAADLEQYTWIEMSGSSGSNKHLQQFWRSNRLSPKRQILCDYPQTIIDLVADGIGIAMVPTHKAEAAMKVGRNIAVLQQFQQTLPLYFIYLDEYEQDTQLALLKQAVAQIWQV